MILKQHRLTLLATVGFASLAIAGCNGGSSAPVAGNATTSTGNSATGDLTSVKIGYNPTIVQPQPLLGVLDGDYAKLVPGVAFTGQDYAAGPAVLEALRAGTVDIACSGVYPALKAFAKEKDVVLIAGAATGGTQLMVANNSPYKTLADLKGKVIGVNQVGSTVDAMLRYDLLQAGLNPETDVRIVQAEPALQADDLKNGGFAAVVAPAPWPSVVATKANAHPLLDWKQFFNGGDYLAGSIYTTKKFADAHPDFIKKFVAANVQITSDLNADRSKGDARVYAAWSKISKKTLPDAVVKDAFATIVYTTTTDPKSLQDFADVAFKVGVLRQKADLSGFVYTAP